MGAPGKSLKFPFSIDHGAGTLASENDFSNHVRQMIFQLLYTNPGERINRSDFGCGIRRMVFAPNDDVTASLAQITIHQSLDRWLGSLIDVQRVDVKAENEKLEIGVNYSLKTQNESYSLNVSISI